MGLTITASFDLSNLYAAERRAVAPFADPAVQEDAWQAMRFGPDSISDQLDRGVTLDGDTATAWDLTKPFGSRKTPRRTLQRTGALREQWLGIGASSTQRGDAQGVAVGVDTGSFPRAGIFQRRSPAHWKADGGNRTKSGQLKARIFLGVEYGVWVSERKALEGWDIPPRRVGVSTAMVRRVADLVGQWIVGGSDAAPQAGAA